MPGKLFVVHRRFVLNPAEASTFLRIMESYVQRTRKEDGCVKFVAMHKTESIWEWCLHVVWKTREDWIAHQKTQHYGDFGDFVLGTKAGQDAPAILSMTTDEYLEEGFAPLPLWFGHG